MRTCVNDRFVVGTEVETVMQVLAAVERWPEWSDCYRRVQLGRRNELGHPLRAFVTASILGRRDEQILEFDWASDTMSWRIVDSLIGARSSGTWNLSANSEGTAVRRRTEIDVPLPLPGILFRASLTATERATMGKFVEFVETYQSARGRGAATAAS
ncbi:SRPBCC family protein [Nocardia salmonicida]|uniref:SRPBCC family protein n=1 Tax=Nocardia salmonicida TaxID=53431 RepID=UPI003CE9C46C